MSYNTNSETCKKLSSIVKRLLSHQDKTSGVQRLYDHPVVYTVELLKIIYIWQI